MKSLSLIMVSCTSLCLITACSSTNTPQYRISKNPQTFESLPYNEQKLVQEGRLCAGMDTKAVFLAWGYPNSTPFVGEKNGKSMTRWVYTRLEPVMNTSTWMGPRWSPYGWYQPTSPLETTYIPQDAATVTFENGKVVSWESQNYPPHRE